MQEADKRGIYCSIMLFGSYNMLRGSEFAANGLWHPDNNLNPATVAVAELLPLEIPASDSTRRYLKTKKEKLGHKLSSV